MTERVQRGGMRVAKVLDDLVAERMLPDTGIELDAFWKGFESIVDDLTPKNRALLATRDALQEEIDAWHLARRGQTHDPAAYKAFLSEIGYIVPEGGDFEIETANVDPEIATMAGPQLVVPVTIARYALNATNARWGSLYDALYGTDVIDEDRGARKERDGYNRRPRRRRDRWSGPRDFLDSDIVPLTSGQPCRRRRAMRINDGIRWIRARL